MRNGHLRLAGGMAGAAVFFATAVQAQTADATAVEASSQNGLVEVVVTAQKRSERLQDVPITVAAVSADTMRTAGVTNIQDLETVVPGLQIGNANGFATPHLRGVGSTNQAPGVESPIAIYVDGVYIASTTSSLFDFIDVDNVEVLKGPQGTLFGRNATGGLIQVTTRTPSQTTQLDTDLGLANYATGKGDLYLTGGITDTLAASVALQVSGAGQGWGRNLVTGNDAYQNYVSASAHTKWLWTPSDGTSVTASLDFSKDRNSDLSAQIAPGASNFPGVPYPAYTSPWDTAGNIDGVDLTQNGGLSLRLDQELGFAKLMDILAYRKEDTTIDFSLEQSGPYLPYFDGLLNALEQQFSEELQLSSEKGSPVIWNAGLYYFHSESQYDPNHAVINEGVSEANTLNIFSPAEQLANSVAAYGQATIPLPQDVNLTLGGRYTYERHTLVGETDVYLPAPVGLVSSTPSPERAVAFQKPSYRVAIDHHLAADTLIYASFNTGFKSGGFNTGSISDSPFLPETLKAYELGIKTDLLDHRVRFNLSGFHYDYEDIQVQKVEAANTGIVNGGAAKVNGADLDLNFLVAGGLTFGVSAEYLNAYFTSFDGAPLSDSDVAVMAPVVPGSAAGNKLPYSPHVNLSASADYVTTAWAGSELHFNATVEHDSSFALESDNVMQQPGFTKLNASIRWVSVDRRYAVLLWGKNLTDAATISYGGTLPATYDPALPSVGLHTVTYGAPRTFGVTFEYHYKK